MKNALRSLALLVLGSCAALGGAPSSISAPAITPAIVKVCARHDAYVRADPLLSDAAEQFALDQSYALQLALNNAIDGKVFVVALHDNAIEVCARHDDYVSRDGKLVPLERDTYLRSTELIRSVIFQAAAGARAPSPTPN